MLLSSSPHPHLNSRGLLSLPCRGTGSGRRLFSPKLCHAPLAPGVSSWRGANPPQHKEAPSPSSAQAEGAVVFPLTLRLSKTTWEVKQKCIGYGQ